MAEDSNNSTPQGKVLSVNVGQPREIEWLGQKATTAIWKSPVAGRVAVVGVNLVGDDQADRRVHGGKDKAIYSYAREDEDWWEDQLERPVEPGTFGENLTLVGLNVSGAVIGEVWEIGSALLEVAQPRIPCWKLGARMNNPDFPPVFAGAGDLVRVVERPSHGMTIGGVAEIYHMDRSRAQLLLEVPQLAETMKGWARRTVRHRRP